MAFENKDVLANVLYDIRAYAGQPIELALSLLNDKGEYGQIALKLNMWFWTKNIFYSTFYQCMDRSGIQRPTNVKFMRLKLLPEHFN